MIPAAFDYVRPESVGEAVGALAGAEAAGSEAKVLAGGQSLLPLLRMRLAFPDLVVDVGRIPGLRGVRDDGDEHPTSTRSIHLLRLTVASERPSSRLDPRRSP